MRHSIEFEVVTPKEVIAGYHQRLAAATKELVDRVNSALRRLDSKQIKTGIRVKIPKILVQDLEEVKYANNAILPKIESAFRKDGYEVRTEIDHIAGDNTADFWIQLPNDLSTAGRS